LLDITMPSANALRSLRVIRVSRAVRVMVRFPELYNMIVGFASAMRAMMWGILMIGLLLLIFAILCVELLHDKQDSIAYSDGTWCDEVFFSVWTVFLLFFQNLVAGDSWGTCALPVILDQPHMFVIFSSVLVLVQLGFTNLILSSIVETATVSRQENLDIMVQRRKQEELESIDRVREILQNIDQDCSGDITMEEFLSGYDTNQDLQVLLKMLDLDRTDISQLFDLMDNDDSGTLSYPEFLNCVRKAETQDLRVQMMVVKLRMGDIAKSVKSDMQKVVESINKLVGNKCVAVDSDRSLGWSEVIDPLVPNEKTGSQHLSALFGEAEQQSINISLGEPILAAKQTLTSVNSVGATTNFAEQANANEWIALPAGDQAAKWTDTKTLSESSTFKTGSAVNPSDSNSSEFVTSCSDRTKRVRVSRQMSSYTPRASPSCQTSFAASLVSEERKNEVASRNLDKAVPPRCDVDETARSREQLHGDSPPSRGA
jgi:Ca2+-binding EF-hand superfamily protein